MSRSRQCKYCFRLLDQAFAIDEIKETLWMLFEFINFKSMQTRDYSVL